MSVTMGGWRTHTARAFVVCFMYGVVPMCALFSLLAGLTLAVYVLKIFVYLLKGDFSLTPTPPSGGGTGNSTAPAGAGADHIIASLLVSPLELAVAAVIMVFAAIVYYFFVRFTDARRREEKQHERALRKEARERERNISGNGTQAIVAEDFGLVLEL